MKRRIITLITTVFFWLLWAGAGISFGQVKTSGSSQKESIRENIPFDDTQQVKWNQDFELVDVVSSVDNNIQKSYFYKSKSPDSRPLIVSLHTWSGNYEQVDELAELCRQKELNYIHPDFRGANKTTDACCSELALADIDDAIFYAIDNARVDTARIFVIGVSGGGYATLSTFMKSRHNIRKFSAWASITDLVVWFHESKIRNSQYATDILECTGSGMELNVENARKKSPAYWVTPYAKLNATELFIYARIYDGIQGSVPISHSINFYNKILKDMAVADSSKYVSVSERLYLLEKRQALGSYGDIAGRKICLKKEFNNVKLVIFEGNHEMLTGYALEELLEE